MNGIIEVLRNNIHLVAYERGVIVYHTVMSWLKTRKQYSRSKKNLYYKAIIGALKCGETKDELSKHFKTEYEFMSKGGEQHPSSDDSYVDDNGYRQGESSRPRALFAGVKYTYGL